MIVAEAVMMALAPITGRQSADDLVYAGCRTAEQKECSLFESLSEDPQVSTALGLDRLASLTDPANDLGVSSP